MEETDLHALERFVAENDELLALEEQIGRFNIFDALGIARAEIHHSNYLAWLLTPGESHGLGDLFLNALLMDIFRKAREQGIAPPVSPVSLDGSELRGVEVRREWNYIDLLIKCEQPRFVIAVENKVDSGEHDNQLQRYEDVVAKEFPAVPSLFVFLTPTGEEPSDDDWVTYSYADVYNSFIRTRRTNKGTFGGDVAVFLEHYLSLIGNRFMENEDVDKLCRQIYSNHRRALDLIWERIGSPESALVRAMENWIHEHSDSWLHVATRPREVEFIPRTWDKMLPPISKRSSKKYDRTHWLTAYLRAERTCLRFTVDIYPTMEAPFRPALLDRLLLDNNEFGFERKKEKSKGEYVRVFSEKICTFSEDEEPDVVEVMKKAEKSLQRFMQRTTLLPRAIAELRLSVA